MSGRERREQPPKPGLSSASSSILAATCLSRVVRSFPWLMTWEENRHLDEKPWDARTLTRGMEFSSYAFATDRKTNVELGTLLDTPAFMWLDAFEKKHTRSALLGALGFVCVCV